MNVRFYRLALFALWLGLLSFYKIGDSKVLAQSNPGYTILIESEFGFFGGAAAITPDGKVFVTGVRQLQRGEEIVVIETLGQNILSSTTYGSEDGYDGGTGIKYFQGYLYEMSCVEGAVTNAGSFVFKNTHSGLRDGMLLKRNLVTRLVEEGRYIGTGGDECVQDFEVDANGINIMVQANDNDFPHPPGHGYNGDGDGYVLHLDHDLDMDYGQPGRYVGTQNWDFCRNLAVKGESAFVGCTSGNDGSTDRVTLDTYKLVGEAVIPITTNFGYGDEDVGARVTDMVIYQDKLFTGMHTFDMDYDDYHQNGPIIGQSVAGGEPYVAYTITNHIGDLELTTSPLGIYAMSTHAYSTTADTQLDFSLYSLGLRSNGQLQHKATYSLSWPESNEHISSITYAYGKVCAVGMSAINLPGEQARGLLWCIPVPMNQLFIPLASRN